MTEPPRSITCPQCHADVALSLLACPSCQWLVHAGTLKTLAAQAGEASAAGDVAKELGLWREALTLLPPDSRQHGAILQKIETLGSRVGEEAHAAETQKVKRKWSKLPLGMGAVALLLWKFKAILLLALGKAKFLLLGFSKAGTLFSMLLSFSVYWAAWGWKFAAGLVLSIYVHEMGHVAALRGYGIKATVPMFIPGFGALIRLKQNPSTPREDAVVGLAGPIWGLGAALVAYGVSKAMDWPGWAAVAQVGAWINLFNLIPVWQLDGARGMVGLARWQKWTLLALGVCLFIVTHEGLLILLVAAGAYQAYAGKGVEKADWGVFLRFVALLIALSLMTRIPVIRGSL